ncbi:ParB/RepB/Spo0J family partition protein [Marinibacterium anthonyi]|nr:ParB/RepB/Spo0J family partition protein [Marinibacterium anthonyi]
MAEILTTITEVRIEEIVVKDRLRPVSEAGVAAIIASVGELGVMKDSIHIRKVKHRKGELVLMAGAHRLAAAKQIGWETVKVTCWTCNDDFARLMEIDDNLAGAELTALDTAVFLAARKRLYEKMHPEMAVGGFRGNQHTGNLVPDIMSFTTSTAEKFGLTERHVRRLVSAGDNLGPDEVRRLRAAPKPVALKDIMEIGKVGNPAERYHVVDRLADGTAKNASAARKLWKAEQGLAPAPASPVDTAFSKLKDAWDRAPKEACLRFLEERGDAIDTLLNDLGRTGDRDG